MQHNSNKLKTSENKIEKKKLRQLLLNLNWLNCFDNIFSGAAKINGVPQVIDQNVCVMQIRNRDYECG
jgi:hypothetical protein